jgi:hypothetical protein
VTLASIYTLKRLAVSAAISRPSRMAALSESSRGASAVGVSPQTTAAGINRIGRQIQKRKICTLVLGLTALIFRFIMSTSANTEQERPEGRRRSADLDAFCSNHLAPTRKLSSSFPRKRESRWASDQVRGDGSNECHSPCVVWSWCLLATSGATAAHGQTLASRLGGAGAYLFSGYIRTIP